MRTLAQTTNLNRHAVWARRVYVVCGKPHIKSHIIHSGRVANLSANSRFATHISVMLINAPTCEGESCHSH